MRLARLLTPLLALALAAPLAGCGGDDEPTAPVPATVETTTFGPSLGIDLNAGGWTRTSTGLYYRTVTAAPATAAAAVNGQNVRVRYTGRFANGAQFETGTYGPFVLGRGAVIAGWDQGVLGMRVGERRQLLIPPSLGYGPRGRGRIPGNSVLVFNVELLSAR